MFAVQFILAGIVSSLATLWIRPCLLFSLTIPLMMAITGQLKLAFQAKIISIIVSTVISSIMIIAWRHSIDRLAFFGSIPERLEGPALLTAALLTICCSLCAPGLGRSTITARSLQLVWPAVLVLNAGILLLPADRMNHVSNTAAQLRHVLQLEARLKSLNRDERQELSFWLGVFGRNADAQAFSTRAETTDPKVPTEKNREVALSPALESAIKNRSLPWRQEVQEIARRQRIVIIMEAHNAPQHREWITEALPVFHAAGFQHYAAETLAETGNDLKQRGYPTLSTGVYVADPRFGNLLRRAIALEFTLHAYEAAQATTIETREEQQAETLTRLIHANPDGKFLIHVGYAHSFKQPVPGVGRWMAARLWQKTEIEPYSIYQVQDDCDSPNYSHWENLAGVDQEPRMLVSPPSGIPDPQFEDIPVDGVDAVVIHPHNRQRAPTERRPVFTENLIQVDGEWLELDWPVVVGAYRFGETEDAIPLDQVLLRMGESRFQLWIPDVPYELRASSPTGSVKLDVQDATQRLKLRKSTANMQP